MTDLRRDRFCRCGHPRRVHAGMGQSEGTGPCGYDSQRGGTSQGDGDCPCPRYRPSTRYVQVPRSLVQADRRERSVQADIYDAARGLIEAVERADLSRHPDWPTIGRAKAKLQRALHDGYE